MPKSARFAVTAEMVSAISSGCMLDEVLLSVAQRTCEVLGLWECDLFRLADTTLETVLTRPDERLFLPLGQSLPTVSCGQGTGHWHRVSRQPARTRLAAGVPGCLP